MFFKTGRQTQGKHLVLIGGNEDKRFEKNILKACLSLSPVSKVAVIPTASSVPCDLAEDYRIAFRDLGIEHTRIIDVRSPHEAENPEYIKDISEADLLFFTGGDQTKLVEVLDGTPIMKAVLDKWQQGMVIAGTSAGAAAAGEITLYDGDDEAHHKGRVKLTKSFGLISGVLIDTHFDARNRLLRLIQALANCEMECGIGLSEDTGIVLATDRSFKVIGSSSVYVVRKKAETHTNFAVVPEDHTWSINNINISILREGDVYCLATHELKYKPN